MKRSSASAATPSQSSPRVETGKGHKRGGRGRGSAGRIQRVASERQEAWLETGRPLTTYRLTLELEGLYGEHRHDQAGSLTDPYHGKTSAVRPA